VLLAKSGDVVGVHLTGAPDAVFTRSDGSQPR
jgi:hypothetical protein